MTKDPAGRVSTLKFQLQLFLLVHESAYEITKHYSENAKHYQISAYLAHADLLPEHLFCRTHDLKVFTIS